MARSGQSRSRFAATAARILSCRGDFGAAANDEDQFGACRKDDEQRVVILR